MIASAETKRRAILAYIRSYHGEHGFAPSLREIVAATGLSSTSMASHHLNTLDRQGLITRTLNIARGIRLKEDL